MATVSLGMKGIIMAGGSGTRLYPATSVISKQLLPVYDKPMIYYPLSTLMLAGVRRVLIITTGQDRHIFEKLLRDGSQFGIQIEYAVQEQPRGLADAFIVGRKFIGSDSVALILGDNIFFGHGIRELIAEALARQKGATIFAYRVADPERYGVIEFDANFKAIAIEEKPRLPKSRFAVTGLYFFDNRVIDIAPHVPLSVRGEIEITEINRAYLEMEDLHVAVMGRGFTWFDIGTHESFVEACKFVQIIEQRQGLRIACLEEIALQLNLISADQLLQAAKAASASPYGQYLQDIYDSDRRVRALQV